jgi:AraC-like DNA-binding protein
MQLLFHHPGPPVSRYVNHFWYYDGYARPQSKEKLLPNAVMELVIDLDGSPKRLFCRGGHRLDQDYRGAWLSGLQTEFLVIEARLGSSMMGVHFRTLGAGAFFPLPMAELAKDVVELEAILGPEARHLREQLLDAPAPETKFRILERFLARRIATLDGDTDRGERLVGHVVERLRQTEQPVSIQRLADELGVTRRHLARLFRTQVGLGPKALARILRFQQVIETVESRGAETLCWADLAYRCGYYDQSHFVQEFREFAGIRPSEYHLRRGDYLNWIDVDEDHRPDPMSHISKTGSRPPL